MNQLVQNSRTGIIKIKDVPVPALKSGMVIVRNRFSLISAGTERSKVELGKKSLLGKALAHPEQVRLVLKQVKENGLLQTAEKVFNKLNTDSAMGYSTSGVVVEVASDVSEFRVGDRVACAGAGYASHAEFVVVPKNLVNKIPDGVSFEDAAYTTLGAIAMQGLRQAAPTLGETVMVIGLGLLGQLLVQLLKANGCLVVGVDVNPESIELAKQHGCDLAVARNSDTLKAQIKSFTNQHGVDAVIITASTSQNDPVEFAADVMRDRGRVVMVGVTGMDLPRTPYFLKELEFKLSRSYGAGRYDAAYEEKGIDYPIGYVRWTEGRNMAAFLTLLGQKAIDLSKITTHVFPIEKGEDAYKLISGEVKERYIGILLDYGEFHVSESQGISTSKNGTHENGTHVSVANPKTELNVGFIGAGSFAQSLLIPNLKKLSGVTLATVCNQTGINAENVKEKFGFENATSDYKSVLADPNIGTVFIATRHNLHAPMVAEALAAGKHVFVEKPLATTEQGLEQIAEKFSASEGQLLVGFNRRFAPLVVEMKKFYADLHEPMSVHYRVNAGFLPSSHWTQDLSEGGGRMIGEGCHFIDTMQYLTSSEPVKIYAEMLPSENRDNLLVTVRFANGSVGQLQYLSNGDKFFPKERIEVFAAGRIAVLENFKTLTLSEQGKTRIRENATSDKGHADEVRLFMESVKSKQPVITFESLAKTTLATFAVNESLNTGFPVEI
jgi:predicted dehydrogenase